MPKKVWPWNRKQITNIWKWPQIAWLILFSWWAEEASSKVLQKWLARYRTVVLIYFTIFQTSMVFTIFYQMGVVALYNNMFTIFSSSPGLVGLGKMYGLVMYRKKLKAAMLYLDEMLLTVRGPMEEMLVRRRLKRSWTMFLVILMVWIAMIVHWLVRPLITALLHGKRTTILHAWPVFIDTWAQFFVTYCYQTPVVVFIGMAYCTYDNMFLCISEYILCHFDVLRHRLSILSLESHTASHEFLECIDYNAKILRTCELLQQSSTVIIIFQSFYMVITLCSGVFLITMVEHKDTTLMLNVLEISIAFVIIFYLYCSYCDEIAYQCQDVRAAAYMSHWIDGSSRNKKDLLLLMIRAMKPVRFGGILEIDKNTFITVMKATFSYYNFMLAVIASNEK